MITNLLPDPAETTDDPRANGRKITALLQAEAGYADLYRKIFAGPSGQRANLHVGRVWYRPTGNEEFTIVDPREGDSVGYARRATYDGTFGWWSITRYDSYTGDTEWMGYAETLSAGVDWCVRDLHAATGRHDSRRVSPAAIHTADQVHADNARKHTAECAPCRDAGQRNGWIDCVTR
jgi:hypothetical protein